MLLKTLFEDYDLNLTKILYKHASQLGLNFDELNTLNALVYYYRDRKSFSLGLFARKINASKLTIEEKIVNLINKELIKIEALTDQQKKIKEIINYDGLFEKLTAIIESIKSSTIDPDNIKKIVEIFEFNLQRTLTQVELLELKTIFTTHQLNLDATKKIILDLVEKNELSIFSFRAKVNETQ
ncbi:MAG: hypothetical protein LBV55_00595 [Acholeplasmatales bacterium]|jgi:hypothetical protein|nr:hypothetical protein [Acholeplasmatales bacterium]